MAGERRLRAVKLDDDPVWRLWGQLPVEWRGLVIGPGIDNWESIGPQNGQQVVNLTELPPVIAAELAWMAHWQMKDGRRVSVPAINHLANALRLAARDGRSFPPSIREMDWDAAYALQGWYFATRFRRLPTADYRSRLHVLLNLPRLALLAACHQGHWWELDEWYPRCDPRIPIDPRDAASCTSSSPGEIKATWLRAAAKWYLGTMLESGAFRWLTVTDRGNQLRRFDRWITTCLDDPVQVLTDPDARRHAASFARWVADPRNRPSRDDDQRHVRGPVSARDINDDVRTVAELFAFVTENAADAHAVLGAEAKPWREITDAHAAGWFRHIVRGRRRWQLNDEHYIDDHALAQIASALPLLGLGRDDQMVITRGDGQQVTVPGLGYPQVMRMILLQILTGRRTGEIRACDRICVEPVTGHAEGEPIARFRYAQTKIEGAPNSILVDQEVVNVIEEQQNWIKENFPDLTPRYLFLQRFGNRHAAKPYPAGSYKYALDRFSDLVQVVDSKGHLVRLTHTHRFRHTKLTRLAELGLPVHVIQRYAGHATPTMTMHYIAQREEHAELAFLATAKLRADGTAVRFSREDHDSLHLFDRADRILPHGWCLLPPAQTCTKGNACLTCSVFVTDASHRGTLERQLADTEQLITQATTAFLQRHGAPMPDDNVWLAQRRAERAALTQLLATMDAVPGRAVEGGGCGASTQGPVPLTLDTSRARRTRP